ncbi:MAG: tyrosine-protein phosphatase [Planctomycetaceae bacterium]
MDSTTPINWIQVHQGRLAIGHRPKLKLIPELSSLGVTHVLTLLSAKEGAERIGQICVQERLEWIWLPLENGQPPSVDRDEDIVRTFRVMSDAIQESKSLFVHCSAGIHRTGMMTHALLGFLGFTNSESRQLLERLRGHTAHGVGDERLAWGDDFISRVLSDQTSNSDAKPKT